MVRSWKPGPRGTLSRTGGVSSSVQHRPGYPANVHRLCRWDAERYRSDRCYGGRRPEPLQQRDARRASVAARASGGKPLLRNPHSRLPKIQRNLYYEIAHIYAGQRIIDKTLQAADAAYAAQPSYEIALQSAVWLLSAGMPEDALQYLRKARKRRAEEWRWVENESETGRIKALESAIRKARDTKGSSGESARGIDPAVGRID